MVAVKLWNKVGFKCRIWNCRRKAFVSHPGSANCCTLCKFNQASSAAKSFLYIAAGFCNQSSAHLCNQSSPHLFAICRTNAMLSNVSHVNSETEDSLREKVAQQAQATVVWLDKIKKAFPPILQSAWKYKEMCTLMSTFRWDSWDWQSLG